jgi:hypothetical protein
MGHHCRSRQLKEQLPIGVQPCPPATQTRSVCVKRCGYSEAWTGQAAPARRTIPRRLRCRSQTGHRMHGLLLKFRHGRLYYRSSTSSRRRHRRYHRRVAWHTCTGALTRATVHHCHYLGGFDALQTQVSTHACWHTFARTVHRRGEGPEEPCPRSKYLVHDRQGQTRTRTHAHRHARARKACVTETTARF